MVRYRAALRVCLALMILLFASGVPTAGPAEAAGTCAVKDNYFNGFLHDRNTGYNFEGASGFIVVRDGGLCGGVTGPGNFVNSWVMIAGSTYAGWSQVGFWREPGQPLRWFSQEHGAGILQTRFSTFNIGGEIGVKHMFRVLWINECSCLRTYIDTYLWSTAPFNPFIGSSGWGATPWVPQFFGETTYLASDVPGQPWGHTDFSALGAQRVSDEVVVQMPCTMLLSQDSPRWAISASACDAFASWTQTF